MARASETRRLCVYLNSHLVGWLDRKRSGAVLFTYDPGWLDWERGHVPVSISMPLRLEPYAGDQALNVFENLLPDSPRIRRNVAERLGARGVDTFSLLDVIGRDCVGALQFLDEGREAGPAGEVVGDPMTDTEIAELLRQLRFNPMGNDPDEDFRLSIAGAQDKTALLRTDQGWQRPVGSTATTHILKPAIGPLQNDIDMSDSVENEHLCLRLCQAFGLETAQTEIVQFAGERVLCVSRFDRLWTKDSRLLRRPQEDFCQALSIPSTRKYAKDGGPGVQDILDRLQESDRPNADRATFLKAQIVFWLLGATDGHAKNFSIHHTPGGGFVMTPLYDVLSAQPVVDAGQLGFNRYKLAMPIGDNNRSVINRIAPRHFAQSADRAGMPRGVTQAIIDDIRERLPQVMSTAEMTSRDGVPDALIESICVGLSARAELLDATEID